MVFNVAVLGSCASRDIFMSKINPNYKDYFNVKLSFQRTSLISIMQEQINFDEKSIEINSDLPSKNFRMKCIKDDLNKNILEDLLDNEIDYLIMDNYFEVSYGILCDGNKIMTNNHQDLHETIFYNNLINKKSLNMVDNTEKYFELYKYNCDLFFKFLAKYCPNTKIILNPVKAVFNVLKKDGKKEFNEYYYNVAKKINPLISMLDQYICDNYDVEILEFTSEVCADENHIWGLTFMHYEKYHYVNLLNQLIEIYQRDDKLDYNFKDLKYKNYKLSNNLELLYFENHDLKTINNNLIEENKILNKYKKYLDNDNFNKLIFKESYLELFADLPSKENIPSNWILDKEINCLDFPENKMIFTSSSSTSFIYPFSKNLKLPSQFELSFHVISWSIRPAIYFFNDDDYVVRTFTSLKIPSETSDIKIIYDNGTIHWYVDGCKIFVNETDWEDSSNLRIGIGLYNKSSINFNNFIISKTSYL